MNLNSKQQITGYSVMVTPVLIIAVMFALKSDLIKIEMLFSGLISTFFSLIAFFLLTKFDSVAASLKVIAGMFLTKILVLGPGVAFLAKMELEVLGSVAIYFMIYFLNVFVLSLFLIKGKKIKNEVTG